MNETEIKTVELIINNDKARKKMAELEKDFEAVHKAKEKALADGDWEGVKKATAAAKKLERQMDGVRTRAESVGKVLANLDKAAPKQLQNTIKQNDDAMVENLCRKATSVLAERNRLCKLTKN